MEISKGIEIVDLALWVKDEKILIINDLHLGYEEVLHKKGILVPRIQTKEVLQKLEEIFKKVQPQKIIINGDLKHEFGIVLSQEWKEILSLLDFLIKKKIEIIIIKGNHDPIIKPIAEKREIKVVNEYKIKDILIVHGDELVETKAKRIIIGHEHPAITIREGSKWEKYKCFLKGRWKNKELLVLPSFNPLLEGTDVLKEQLLSPFLDDLKKFEIFIVNKGEVFNFGRINNLK